MQRRALLLLPLALAACTSPNPVLYTLAALPGQALPGGPSTAELRRIGLAGYLDRPGVVRSSQDFRLQFARDDRWGAPLGEMIERVLAEDLTQRLPDCTVYTESGAISADPDRIIEIDMQRFDGDAAGNVVLAAEVAVRPGDSHAALATRTMRFSVTPRSPATGDFVSALSTALGQLADAVAEILRTTAPQAASAGHLSGPSGRHH